MGEQAGTLAPAARAGTITLGGDLSINRLGFGAMRLTGPGIWGPPVNRAECQRVLRRAVELGVNLIDTADSYGPEISERLIAETLYPYPTGLVIATKAGLKRTKGGSWHLDGRPEYLRSACDASLGRLRLDRIDVYQLHGPDPNVPLEESIGAFVALQREGKVRHIGLCNVTVEQLAKIRRVTPVVSVQNRYNLADRTSEEMLKSCEQQDLAFIPWNPIGDLTRNDRPIRYVARRHHAAPAQVAIAWLLRHSRAMLPIPGTSQVKHLRQNVAAAGLLLSSADIKTLD